ncbi:MAG: hypothetical protein HZA95_01410 [Candidatus Vogelbacteria bacterium]|nr:hypothetical protein [Candidatus Vogelbacteria bacterium]
MIASFVALAAMMAGWMYFITSIDSRPNERERLSSERVTANAKTLEQIELGALVIWNDEPHLMANRNKGRSVIGLTPVHFANIYNISDVAQGRLSVTTSGDPKFVEHLLEAIAPAKATTK